MRVLLVSDIPARFGDWTAFLRHRAIEVVVAGPHRGGIADAVRPASPDVVLVHLRERGVSVETARALLERFQPGLAIAFIAVVPSEAIPALPPQRLDDLLDEAAAPEEVEFRVRRAAERRPPTEVRHGPLTLSRLEARALLHGRPLRLTRREFDLLLFLVNHSGRVLRREDLLLHVWGPAFRGSIRSVDVCVRRLRRQLGDFGRQVESVLGVGYRFVPAGD